MQNKQISGVQRDLGISPAKMERVLIRAGLMDTEGQLLEAAVLKGYLTKERELTPRGQGFLAGFMGRCH